MLFPSIPDTSSDGLASSIQLVMLLLDNNSHLSFRQVYIFLQIGLIVFIKTLKDK